MQPATAPPPVRALGAAQNTVSVTGGPVSAPSAAHLHVTQRAGSATDVHTIRSAPLNGIAVSNPRGPMAPGRAAAPPSRAELAVVEADSGRADQSHQITGP